jgi:hypothetical protein
MEAIARKVEIISFNGYVQTIQHASNSIGVTGIDASAITLREEAFQTFVPEASDHGFV